MKGLSYYYDRNRFETIDAVLEYYKVHNHFVGAQVNIIFCGVLVGNIDIDRLSAEVRRNAKGG